MHERMYKTLVHDSHDLNQHLTDKWASVSLNIINKAVDQWKKWLHGYLLTYFEHLLN